MEELETNYQGSRLRYYIFSNNDLLLNANDVCAILNNQPKFLNDTYVNLADAAGAAVVLDMTFGEWLLMKFSGYNQTVDVRPSELQ